MNLRNFSRWIIAGLLGMALLLFIFRFADRFVSPFQKTQKPKTAVSKNTIINTHEHMQSIAVAPRFREAMLMNDIETTVIVGSPEATLLTGRQGFTGYDQNNLEVIKIAKTYPDHFIAFPTIYPHDPEKLKKLDKYMRLGGRGLKLYSGHTMFHDMRLDDPAMFEIYDYCQKKQVPVLFHVNAGTFKEEFENVLRQYPRMKVICPHFCLSTIATDRFDYLMSTYPNLYTDISFGFYEYLKAGLERLSNNPEPMRQMILKYQNRILFATDMVATQARYKTVNWMAEVALAYRHLLEAEEYTFFLLPGKKLRGLNLPPEVLKKIYRGNFENFYGKPV